jgi:hypothetical protein
MHSRSNGGRQGTTSTCRAWQLLDTGPSSCKLSRRKCCRRTWAPSRSGGAMMLVLVLPPRQSVTRGDVGCCGCRGCTRASWPRRPRGFNFLTTLASRSGSIASRSFRLRSFSSPRLVGWMARHQSTMVATPCGGKARSRVGGSAGPTFVMP